MLQAFTNFTNYFTLQTLEASVKELFSNVPMSAKFCNVLCYKCSWYFMATLNHLIFFVCSVYWFHVHFMYECYYIIKVFLFHMTIVLIMLKIIILKMDITSLVMIMVLTGLKTG